MALKNLYTNPTCLRPTGQNQSFGNFLCYVMFCYNFCKNRDYKLNITTDNNLFKIFDLEEYKSKSSTNIINYFAEEYIPDVDLLKEADRRNLEKSLELLYDNSLILPDNITFTGWFYNVPLFSKIFFEDISIKQDAELYVRTKYKDILEDDSIAVHYRGTDFNGHLGYDLRLPFSYYEKCIQHMKTNHCKIKNVYVFSDDEVQSSKLVDFIKSIDLSLNVYSVHDEYYFDWLTLHLSKNIIASNSSFCSTACISNKEVCYQPERFQLRNTPISGVYPCEPFFEKAYIL